MTHETIDDPYPTMPPPAPPAIPWYSVPEDPRKRRSLLRRPWFITVMIVSVIFGVIVLIGVAVELQTGNSYKADLTRGSGDFLTVDDSHETRFYARDGFHVVINTPGWVFAGLTTRVPHTKVGVEADVLAVTAPDAAAFGPFVLVNQTGAGYGLLVDGAGSARLVEIGVDNQMRTVSSATAPALGGGATRRLLLTVDIGSDVHLAGYVDGVKVVSGTATERIPDVACTGLFGNARTERGAEWVATRFARLDAADLPA